MDEQKEWDEAVDVVVKQISRILAPKSYEFCEEVLAIVAEYEDVD